MHNQERPPFVLCFAGDMSGCGFHRMAVPLMSLAMSGLAEGRIDVNAWPIEMIEAIAPDTIVFQRWVDERQVALMKLIREKLPNVLLVYELDDYLGEVPPASVPCRFHAARPAGEDQGSGAGLRPGDHDDTTDGAVVPRGVGMS